MHFCTQLMTPQIFFEKINKSFSHLSSWEHIVMSKKRQREDDGRLKTEEEDFTSSGSKQRLQKWVVALTLYEILPSFILLYLILYLFVLYVSMYHLSIRIVSWSSFMWCLFVVPILHYNLTLHVCKPEEIAHNFVIWFGAEKNICPNSPFLDIVWCWRWWSCKLFSNLWDQFWSPWFAEL